MVVGRPGDNKTATVKGGNRRLVLRTVRMRVDQELVADRIAAAIVTLAANIAAGAVVMAAVVTPRDYKAALGKTRYRRIIMTA